MNIRLSATRLLPVLAAAWLAAGCDVTINGFDAARVVQREKKDFQVSGVPDLALSTFDGSIEIRAWDRPDVSIEIEKHGSTKAQVDRIEVKATQSGNRITVEVRSSGQEHVHFGFSGSRSARIIASVPRQTNLEARTGDGSISIDRISGKVQLTTGDGSISAVEIAGDLRAHTGDGSISIERADGTLDVDTGDGSIAAGGKLERVRLRSGDGNVRLRADTGSRMTEDWDVHTGDGSVAIELPEPFDADVDVHSGSGRVSVESVTVRGEVSRDTVRGQMGAGGRNLRVRTGDGSITISRS